MTVVNKRETSTKLKICGIDIGIEPSKEIR